MNSERDCEHGQLKRSCEICESEREIAELRTENAELRDRLEAIAKAQREPVAWASSGCPDGKLDTLSFSRETSEEHSLTGCAVPLYTAQPSPAADVLVEALKEIAAADRGEGGCYYTNRSNIELASNAIAAYEKERQK